MNLVDISSINLIPELLHKLDKLSNEIKELKQHLKPKYNLTKRADVIKYLHISESTLARWLKEGELKEGYHYYREIKGSKPIITFVSGAIEEFKKEKTK